MKTTLLSFSLLLLSVLGISNQAQAQVRYESIAGGDWNSSSTWRVIGGNSSTSPYPDANGNNEVVISHPVRLNMNYTVGGADGMLTITATGSLEDSGLRTLQVGESARNARPRIMVFAHVPATGLALNLWKLDFFKAQGTINAPILTASCMSIGNNTDLLIPASTTITGNLTVTQGNNDLNNLDGGTTGTLHVRGQIIGSRGAIRNFTAFNLIVDGNNFDCNARAVPLPVELTSFDARYQNKQVTLNWATATEKNADSFTVERSFDGKSFEALTVIKAAGNSNSRKEYSAIDRSMRTGTNYYRLKQADLDGKLTYTQAVPVQVGSIEQQLQAYGDNGRLNIEVQTPAIFQALRVTDSMGRLVYAEEMPAGLTGLVSREIPITGTGSRQVYIIQAVTTQGVMNQKFMVTN